MRNRYNDTVHINKLKEGIWEFFTLDDVENPVDYGWGFSQDEDGVILSVDPPGGPYISTGIILRDIDVSLPKEQVLQIISTRRGVLLIT